MSQKRNTTMAYVCLIVTFFCWGSVYVANRYILRSLTSFELACCRFLAASVALGICLLGRKEQVRIRREDIKYFSIVAFMGYYISIIGTLLSVEYAGASLSSLINSMNPVFITALAAVFLGEKITGRKAVCLFFALVGAYIVSSGSAVEGELLGVVFGLGGVLTWAFAVMYARRLSSRYGALLITTLSIAGSVAFHIPTAIFDLRRSGLPPLTPFCVACILYSGIVGTALPQFLWNTALSRLPASTCSMFYPLLPVFSTLLAVGLLGEEVTVRFLIGGIIIVCTVVGNCFGEKTSVSAKD